MSGQRHPHIVGRYVRSAEGPGVCRSRESAAQARVLAEESVRRAEKYRRAARLRPWWWPA